MDIVTYAAGVSTAALIISVTTATIQVRKALTEGVKIRMVAMSEARILSVANGLDPDRYVALRVTNTGTSPTTLTNMLLFGYESEWDILRRRPNYTAVVNTVSGGGLPFVLKPGEVWSGQALYNDQLRTLLASGRLHTGVAASHRKREFLIRLRQKPSAVQPGH